MFVLILFGCVKIVGVYGCFYLCNILLKMVWVSNENNFVLINIKGEIVYYFDDLCYL